MFRDAQVRESFGDYKRIEAQRSFACFDLLGADVMLDQSLEPQVLEISVGPNMWVDNHGKEHQPRLTAIKAPLVQQLARWAARRSRNPPRSLEEAEQLEGAMLLNFTRLL